MPHIADKPFTSVLAEDVRYDPQQGLLANVGDNLARAGDKVIARNMYRDRARQMNQALAQWQQDQAALRQRMAAAARPAAPLMGYPPPSYLA